MKVPFLTTNQIENETLRLLSEYSTHFGQIASPPVDIEGIIESLLKLDLRFADLKPSLGRDVLGATWIAEREVRIDESLDPTLDYKKEGRYRFTLAHEAGHWQLHRPLIEAESLQGNLFGMEAEPSIVCRSSAKDPMEWQADSFAGYLLMPESLVRQQWLYLNGNMAPYPASDEIENRQLRWSLTESHTPIVSVARELAEAFRVSGQAMQIRLIGLGLIQTGVVSAQLFN